MMRCIFCCDCSDLDSKSSKIEIKEDEENKVGHKCEYCTDYIKQKLSKEIKTAPEGSNKSF